MSALEARVTADIEAGLADLTARDPDLARIAAEIGPPPLRLRESGFSGLLRAITAQQVSTAAASSIWNRFAVAVDPLEPHILLGMEPEALRAVGLSRAKVAYARGLAEALHTGTLDLEALVHMEDEEALARLVALKGIGRWTGEIYLMFALGRPDVFPGLDLALQVAMQRVKGLEARPTPKQALEIAEAWRPWRSIAARLLWHAYRTTPP